MPGVGVESSGFRDFGDLGSRDQRLSVQCFGLVVAVKLRDVGVG